MERISRIGALALPVLLFGTAPSFAADPDAVSSPPGGQVAPFFSPAAGELGLVPGSWDRSRRPVPSDEALEARGAVFGDIFVVAHDIFDTGTPGESNKLYRVSNKLHRTTRTSVIRRQLLFRTGEPFSRRVLAESERLLRRNPYLYEAEILLVDYRNNHVDVVVETRDVWTLKPGLSVGRSGGVSTAMFKLQDQNLLGYGKSLTFKQGSEIDRDVLVLRYEDSNVLGSRVHLRTEYADLSDGERRFLDVEQPFYSLDSRWAAGFRYLDDSRIDSRYALGEVFDEFRHRETVFEVHGGLSRGLAGGRARRWIGGVTFEEHSFGPPFPLHVDVDLAPPTAPEVLPGDRTLIYPWIGFDSQADRYVEAHDLDQIGRTEDLGLGLRYRLQLGYAAQAFGSDRDAFVFGARLDAGLRPGEGKTLLFQGEASGRWGSSGAEDVRLSGRGRFYWRDFGHHLFFVNVEVDAVENLDFEDQLLLGGDSGLRGYPLRYQDGEKRFLLTLEQRFFTDWYPFRLFYLGGAVFFDVGRTWGGGLTEELELSQGLLKNVGVGLRLSSSRSGLGSVIHFDVALPLDGDPSIEKLQWLVKTKASF